MENTEVFVDLCGSGNVNKCLFVQYLIKIMKEKKNQSKSEFVKIDKNKMSTISAMLQCKCPICTSGDMFKSKATDLRRFNELKPACEVCGYQFMPEPGFYQISLFFTYVVSVAIFIVFGISTYYLLNDPPLWVYYFTIITPAILVAPWNLRYSKVLMLYFFGGK